ncbi:MAG: serine/threonine protein kinase, partial [Gammaproteobacteria bacterium]|nr:serine/threonine protein kinase [Gammaproteobacteria bacterium]
MVNSHSINMNRGDDALDETQAGYIKTDTESNSHAKTESYDSIKQTHPYPFLNAPTNKNDIGDIGHYQISDTLGQGGMGFVFKAHDSQLHRTVALKVMKPALCSQPNAKERFLHEARAMASIQSDHVAVIHQVGEQNDIPFLAMEFLQGETMEQWIKSHEHTPTDTIIKWGMQICEGLIPAHKKNLIHRDIKPANLWIEAPDNRIKILDFGLAYALDSNEQLTQTGYILGTLEYMAPEQIDSSTISAQSDLFSLGCVLYQLASNSSPFSGSSQLSILKNLATITPLPLQQIRSDIPNSLSMLIAQLLEKSPEKRPASAHEVLLRLQKINQEPSFLQKKTNTQSNTKHPSSISKTLRNQKTTSSFTTKKIFLVILSVIVLLFIYKHNKSTITEIDSEDTRLTKPEEIDQTEKRTIPLEPLEEEWVEPEEYVWEDREEELGTSDEK